MALCVVLRDGAKLGASATERRPRVPRTAAAPVPDAVFASPRYADARDAPRFRQADPVGNAAELAASRDSLANPEALDWFVQLAAQRR